MASLLVMNSLSCLGGNVYISEGQLFCMWHYWLVGIYSSAFGMNHPTLSMSVFSEKSATNFKLPFMRPFFFPLLLFLKSSFVFDF
jgi:hypothetical protein